MKGCGNKLLSMSIGHNLPLPRVHLERFTMTEGRIASSCFIILHDFSPSYSQQCTDSRDSSCRVRTHVKHPRLESQTIFSPFPSICCRRTTYFAAIIATAADCKGLNAIPIPILLLRRYRKNKFDEKNGNLFCALRRTKENTFFPILCHISRVIFL